VDGAKAASSILSVDQKNVGALFLRGFCLYHKDNVDRAITHFQQVSPPSSVLKGLSHEMDLAFDDMYG
jgi:hypothetical protein